MRVVEYTYHDYDVRSTALSEIWYCAPTKELYVKFRGSGTIAGYSNITPEHADALVEAPSIGREFSKIKNDKKNRYPGINTEGVTFRSAPGLSRTQTTAVRGRQVSPWGYVAPAVKVQEKENPAVLDVNMLAVQGKVVYRVTGRVMQPVEVTVEVGADSFDGAVKAFEEQHGKAAVEVSKVEKV